MSACTSPRPRGLAAAVREWARHRPRATALTFVDHSTDRSGVTTELTYGELDARAQAVAGALVRGCAPGDRAAILCPHTADYVVALLGCLYSEVIAVPLYAPEAFRTDERLRLAMADCAPAVVLTTSPHARPVHELLAGTAGTAGPPSVLCVDTVEPGPRQRVILAEADRPHDIAYLQYTSGSTRDPAGVQVTHRNLAVGAEQLRAGLGIGADARIAGWLPFFHDMGLLLMLAVPLTSGVPAVLMPPFSFVQRPVRWLTAISEHRATHTVSPNFGLDLCVDRIPAHARTGLDLSSLRTLVNGSEPVRAASLDRFSAAFGPFGFRPEAHSPGYGLAEATLAVTLGGPSEPTVLTLDRAELAQDRVRVLTEGGPDGYRVVSCGTPAGQEVRIVAPGTGATVTEGRTGEVRVRGANVCAGYWRRPERTAEVFAAGDPADPDGRWLRTGDLGFLWDGELYLTGRLKDLIIVEGRNHHPSDLEQTVHEASSAVRRGHVAAFSTGSPEEGGERAVIVAELERRCTDAEREALRAAIRAAVVARHSLDPRDVVLVRRGALPRTTSGKIRRAHCRDRYLAGTFDAPDPAAATASAAVPDGAAAR
ncbi:fatty acyl-AMP ligase [Streptomyces sp. ME02-6979.5a]|uniref:fatty acyl-AMP ligase n=1 Tax=Streptomyces sp. ME02-6979.5a TaxID=462925 RepID=UPI0029A2CA58|nr:fatty acyl-AMP ligase [Streptomyces sp. ME02-6979.5a]MDX3341492.1 fatty acyl-AMP ligase [Streptomyces sp. ME02-6979.5a]